MNQEYKVNLSKGQKAKLAKAIRDGSALKLRLGKNALSGNDELLLSPRQIAKLQKAKRNNSGVEISFSKSSIRKSVKHGGSLWTSLFSLGTKALPFVTKGVSKVAPPFVGGQKPIQPHPHLGSNSLKAKPKWKDIPLSNFDLLKWVDFLKIKNFKGIFSRDSKDHLHKTGSCIINLDDKIGNGTHWVATDIKGKNVFYFDSFSMPPPIEFVHYAKKIKKKIIFNSGHPIQELQSVRCGYYCLYFLNEIREKTFYDVLSVFSLNDPMKNERFIKIYFH